MSITATLRSITRARTLAITVVATLALGVAALTTTFGVVNAALFRQPPFAGADRLALLFLNRNPRGEPPQQERWSFARFERLRESQHSFETLGSFSPASLTLSGDADAEVIQGERVSAAYFRVLGVGAATGRVFTEQEDDPASPAPVAVISLGLATRRFGGPAAAIGNTARINGVPLTIVGVLPREFAGLSGHADVWVPRTMTPQLTYAEYLTTNQNFISAIGRLRPGVSLASARGELAVLGADINRAIPSDPDYPDERVTATATPLNEVRVARTVRRSLFILLGSVVLLHLLACANVANLLLGRAAMRRRESAVRLALGSSAGRLSRHILGEGLLLALAGGALGVALAVWTTTWITPPMNVWAARNFYGSVAAFDAPAFGGAELAFGAVLALATAVLVAALPAVTAFRLDVASNIKAGARGIMGGGGGGGGALRLRRPSLRGVIVGAEAALAMLLVIGAGLLIDSFQRMQRADIGVDAENVLTFWIFPSEARVPVASAPAFIARILEAVAAVPGVRFASVDGGAPLAGSASSVLYVDGRPTPAPGRAPPVLRHYVGPDHFATLGIPVRRGRVFTRADAAGAPRVTVISETAARRFWPDEDPIGRRVWFGSGNGFGSRDSSAEIVGIVGDVVYQPLDQSPNFASFYTPYTQFTYGSRMVFVKTAGDPRGMVPDMRRAVASVDPELALRDVQPLTDVVSGSWARHRFDALLFGGFGVAALLLAATGIFAVLSHEVANRTREFGIRIALGAESGMVLRRVLREGMAFPLVGLAAGATGAGAAARVLRSSLYGVSPYDPRVFAGTALLLVLVAAAACLVPAWRATRADPMEALRAE